MLAQRVGARARVTCRRWCWCCRNRRPTHPTVAGQSPPVPTISKSVAEDTVKTVGHFVQISQSARGFSVYLGLALGEQLASGLEENKVCANHRIHASSWGYTSPIFSTAVSPLCSIMIMLFYAIRVRYHLLQMVPYVSRRRIFRRRQPLIIYRNC